MKKHTKNKEGRYIVYLPFKSNKIQSPDGHAREIAINRLQQLEMEFEKINNFKKITQKL